MGCHARGPRMIEVHVIPNFGHLFYKRWSFIEWKFDDHVQEKKPIFAFLTTE